MRVFLNKELPEIGMKLLIENKIDFFLPQQSELSHKEWLAHCQQAEIILNVGKNNFDASFFDTCPNVKAISLFSVGYNHVDINEASKLNVAVGNTPDVLSKATSDTAFLLMLATSRRASSNFESVKSGKWSSSLDPTANLGQELYGKTIGIYGLGRIGYEMARKCKYAYDMNIIYHNRSRNDVVEKELNAQYVDFWKLIAKSDVLSIHANYTDGHQNMFNSSVFEKMKPTSILINTARGGFVSETDLYQAIVTNKIWGAGLDVTNPEPMAVSSPLLDLSTVCILPHIGSATIEARNGMAKLAVENVIAFVQGKKMPNGVN